MERVILHADMNNCYASIEAKLNPKLKGIPSCMWQKRGQAWDSISQIPRS